MKRREVVARYEGEEYYLIESVAKHQTKLLQKLLA